MNALDAVRALKRENEIMRQALLAILDAYLREDKDYASMRMHQIAQKAVDSL